VTTGPVDQLSFALDVTDPLIAAVRGDQWDGPTPCSGWCVRDLVSHLVTGNTLFASAVGGQPPPPPRDTRPDADLLRAYRASGAALLDAFRRPGALDTVVAVPFGSVPGIVALHLRMTEVLVHGWDLARATGQPATFPEDLAAQELAFTEPMLAQIPPDRHPFAPPRPVARDAPAIDRLAACLGRDVTRQAPASGSSA
jgi:uncharacterized protein (TIGR03086 family)